MEPSPTDTVSVGCACQLDIQHRGQDLLGLSLGKDLLGFTAGTGPLDPPLTLNPHGVRQCMTQGFYDIPRTCNGTWMGSKPVCALRDTGTVCVNTTSQCSFTFPFACVIPIFVTLVCVWTRLV